MKHLRSLYFIIPAVLVLTATVGFFITFPVAPNAAYARIIIDLGALIALLSACMTVQKSPDLKTDEISDAIRDLARGNYDKRLNSLNFEELNPVAQAFNELAGSLSDSADPNVNRLRYQYVKKETLQSAAHDHSHHPELGHVESVTHIAEAVEEESVEAKAPEELEQESPDNGPSMVPTPVFAENSQVPTSTSQLAQEPVMKEIEPAQDLPETPAVQKSELEELYEHFCDAHKEQNKEPISFEEFNATIDQAKSDLLAAHQCKAVRFEVVLEGSEVALRPRLIR